MNNFLKKTWIRDSKTKYTDAMDVNEDQGLSLEDDNK